MEWCTHLSHSQYLCLCGSIPHTHLAELGEFVVAIIDKWCEEHVASKGEEANHQAKDQLAYGARRLVEDRQTDCDASHVRTHRPKT